ncbi:hypothetical protein H6F93_29755 [Leptolyngbya sp. FACHB-671]|uniref:hypothetical protein n=1 Tax=Leptolyngbya sp. FACHB-671 TaxID=2692812 RepID=UPI0016834C46|nr:hypothetical protein [Leptolyngbya sp. FACHB-671]MBD2071657.1 hypothetical protein [Leptolyngbya sp. FACHB-671]
MQRPSRYQEVSSTAQPNVVQVSFYDSLIGTLIIVLPLLIAVGVIFRKRRRASALRKQIAVLEQLWQINLTRDDCH